MHFTEQVPEINSNACVILTTTFYDNAATLVLKIFTLPPETPNKLIRCNMPYLSGLFTGNI